MSTQLLEMGERVRRRRKELGWTLEDLSDRVGLSKTFLSGVENGRQAPGMEALLALADGLGLGLDQLVRGPAEPPRVRSSLDEVRSELASLRELVEKRVYRHDHRNETRRARQERQRARERAALP